MLSQFLQRLMFVKQFEINNGRINILGEDYVMVNSASLAALQEIDQEEVYNAGKKASKNDLDKFAKHANVYKNIKSQELANIASLARKIGQTDEGTIKTLETVFEIYGLGKLNVITIDNEKKTALIRIPDSTIASTYKKKSKSPVCSFTSGVLAGIFSFIFKKDVNCREKQCKGKGDSTCEFEIA